MDELGDEHRQSSLQFGGWISRKTLRKPRRSILEIIDPDNFATLLDGAHSELKPQSRTTSSANLNCDKGPITRSQLVETMTPKEVLRGEANHQSRKPFYLTAPVSPRPLQRLIKHKRNKSRLIIGQLSPKREQQVSYLSRSKSPDSMASLHQQSGRSLKQIELHDDSTNTSSSIGSFSPNEIKHDTDIRCHRVKWSAFKKLHKKLDLDSPQRQQIKSHSPQNSCLYPSNLPHALKSPILNKRGLKVFKRKAGLKQSQNLSFSCNKRVTFEESLSPEPSDLTQSFIAKRLTRHEPVGMNSMKTVNLNGRLFAERWATKRNDYTMIEFLKRIEQKRPLKNL